MKMRALVLFKGTGSIDKALEAAGWEVHSVDIDPKFQATETCDIMAWDPSRFDVGHFDFIWASPVCTEFSIVLQNRPRVLERGDALVQRALFIIETLQPRWWLLENPQTGYLKTRPYMQGLPFVDVDYCKFGFPYRKRTRLWGNVPFVPPALCSKEHRCNRYENGRHPVTINRAPRHVSYRIPPLLCETIVAAMDPSYWDYGELHL
jgi:hypothetical protein